MKATKLRAVEMVRRIRDRHTRQLAGKTEAEIIPFYRATGEAATEDLHQRAKARGRKSRLTFALEPPAFNNRGLSVALGRRGSAQPLARTKAKP